MNTTTPRGRSLVALLVASVVGAVLGMTATTAVATPGASIVPASTVCTEADAGPGTPWDGAVFDDPASYGPVTPPSDFLRGTGRTEPAPH